MLHVIPSTSPIHGGPSHAIGVMARALARKGVSVTIATTNDAGPGRSLNTDAESNLGDTQLYRARKWADTYKFAPALLPWLWRHLPTFDVVHIHALFSFSSTASGWIARSRRVPYVLRPLGTLSPYALQTRRPRLKQLMMAANERPLLRRAAAIHFTSELERAEAEALGVPMRSAVIPLGIEPMTGGDRGRLLSRYPKLTGKRIVLFLSRLDPKKNLEALIESMALVVQDHPDAVLLVAGRGEPQYERHLHLHAERLADRIVWAGHLMGEDKVDAFASADLFVLPSHSENFGIAALEAMSAGCACVLGEGVGDAVRLAGAGAVRTVVPQSLPLAQAIIELLGDAPARQRLGTQARMVAHRDFSSDIMAERLIDLYRAIARGRAG